MYITPINNFKTQPFSFRGDLDEKLENKITQIAESDAQVSPRNREQIICYGQDTINGLKEAMAPWHFNTVLRIDSARSRNHYIFLEIYNSLLDVGVPIYSYDKAKGMNNVIAMPDTYWGHLPEYAMTCAMFKNGFAQIEQNMDEVVLDKAVDNLKKGIYEYPQQVYVRGWEYTTRKEYIDKIMQYQEETNQNKYARKELEEMPIEQCFPVF